MHAHKVPYHPKVTRIKKQITVSEGPLIGYHF
jgi:hypothetical protein